MRFEKLASRIRTGVVAALLVGAFVPATTALTRTASASQGAMISFHDGSDFYEVRMEDGELTATRNAEPLSDELLVRYRDHVIVEDENGDVAAYLRIGEDGTFYYTGGVSRSAVRSRPLKTRQIGVSIGRTGRALAAQLGLDESEGILVQQVVRGAPAEKAGIEDYDVITEIDGRKIRRLNDLREALERLEDDASLALTVLRRGEELEIEVLPELRDSRVGLAPLPPEPFLAPGVAPVPGVRVPNVLELTEEGRMAVVSPGAPLVVPEVPRGVTNDEMERLQERLDRLEALLQELVENR